MRTRRDAADETVSWFEVPRERVRLEEEQSAATGPFTALRSARRVAVSDSGRRRAFYELEDAARVAAASLEALDNRGSEPRLAVGGAVHVVAHGELAL